MKRARTGTPEAEPPAPGPTTLSHITGVAALHNVLVRVVLAEYAPFALGLQPCVLFTSEDVEARYAASEQALVGDCECIDRHELRAVVLKAYLLLIAARMAVITAPTAQTALTDLSGAAAVHMLFIRVAQATDAAEVLGMVFLTSEEVWFRFRTSYRALYFNGANIAWIVKHDLFALVYDANERLWWAKEAMWDMLLAQSAE